MKPPKRLLLIVSTLLAGWLWAGASLAQTAPYDAVSEQRARDLYKELRCMVCESQSIADSNTELAAAMRLLVQDKIDSGWRNDEIKHYLRERYGDKVLLSPPLSPATYLLWFAPVLILLAGIVLIRRVFLSPNAEDRQ